MDAGKRILIQAPSELPFGVLGNNALFPMKMGTDPKPWDTVSKYVYGSMCPTTSSRELLRFSKSKGPGSASPFKLFQELLTAHDNDLIKRALEKAHAVKFSTEMMKEVLLSTGSAPLIYMSGDEYIGGMSNVLGKSLMQVRHLINIEANRQAANEAEAELQERKYQAFIALRILERAMKEGDWALESVPQTVTEIVAAGPIPSNLPAKESVLQLISRGQFPEIDREIERPGSIIESVKRQNIKAVQSTLLAKRAGIIFDMYMNYRIEKDYSDLDHSNYDEAKRLSLAKLSAIELSDLKARIESLYNLGMLSARLSDQIERVVGLISIPSDRDIAMSEISPVESIGAAIVEPSAIDKKNYSISDIVAEGHAMSQRHPGQGVVHLDIQPLFIPQNGVPEGTALQLLSPNEFSGEMLIIDGLKYPTVTHYLLTVQMSELLDLPKLKFTSTDSSSEELMRAVTEGTIFSKLGDVTIPKQGIAYGYQWTMVNPMEPPSEINGFTTIPEISNRFSHSRNHQFTFLSDFYLRRALTKKFSNLLMADTLTATGTKELVYIDREDTFIGASFDEDKKKKGSLIGHNMTGQILTTIRATVRESTVYVDLGTVTQSTAFDAILRDMYLQEWIKMRIRDMCTAVDLAKLHLSEKTDGLYDFAMTTLFVESVLDGIYQPCQNLTALSKRVTVKCPQFLRDYVYRQKSFGKSDSDTVELIWSRIAVMIFFMIQALQRGGTERVNVGTVKAYLSEVEQLVSKKVTCEPIDEDAEDEENCIASALLNVLSKLHAFNDTHIKHRSGLEAVDVTTAVRIILGERERAKKDDDDSPNPYDVANLDAMFRAGKEDGPDSDKDSDFEFEIPSPVGSVDSDNPDKPRHKRDGDDDPDSGIEMGFGNAGRDVARDRLERLTDDIDALLTAFEKGIEAIQFSKLPKKFLTNRVNFFATIQ